MRIEYADDTLRRAAEERGFLPKQWGPELLKAYRKKVGFLAQANDDRDLYNYKALHLEKLSGDRRGTSSVRLNSQFRLILNFRTDPTGRTVIVLDVTNHYH
ncbi:type II toxin-antitoxin system RelE/ParE family toxin [Corynebacterium glyciniphilum]|uniref:type II toxin-antitoxin system RelE/ParE family toxin n=1 Tax=Corynebacterium glyciniphilum TaxID=1404244 RepID=UPI002655C55B|nr:type II toxin-antitoxin system RelE/ParE family toxin [Corynebacterium glyciniphilum]MDN6706345.1 type II toxin-antitoxin system RelE/ParE family toxin [Corynebacterium glyciniphilum]